jgi:FkbM family methyltransferase
MSRYVFFDIGTNWGEDSLGKCHKDPNMEVWAFEPTPQLVNHLQNASMPFRDRYHIIPMAVSDFNGVAKFYIQNNPGMGCNSLNTFNQDAITKYWEQRNVELSAIGYIEVQVCNLETWIKNNLPDLEKIDHFHCDTQGCDLKVLKGMGEYIHLIKTGKVECSKDEEIKLYHESDNYLSQTIEFLKSKDFTITSVESNDHRDNEWNVYFAK